MSKKLIFIAVLFAASLLGVIPFIVNADAVITVDSTGDDIASDGQCTLRGAIANANNDSNTDPDCETGSGTDTIEFALTGGAPYTISPTSSYSITSPIIIDGASQTGTVCSLSGGRQLQINIDASGVGDSNTFSFNPGSTGSRISGLAIFDNGSFRGIGITSGAITVSCNNIGTDAEGLTAYPNELGGIDVQQGGTNSVIGGPSADDGNLVSGNNGAGITLGGVSGVTVQGNWIGVDITGNAVLSNIGDGISLYSNAPTVSDGVQILDNIVSGNGTENDVDDDFSPGIDIGAGQDEIGTNRYITNVIVQGNIIGLSADGTMAIPNEKDGIFVSAGVSGLLIGGPNPGDGNVLSGNGKDSGYSSSGLVIWYGSDDITIQGNIIGLNPAGDTAIPNGYDGGTNGGGIRMSDTDRTHTSFDILIGGNTPGARNVISGNPNYGIVVDVDDVTISGNYIGTDITGTSCMPVSNQGIVVASFAKNTVIGGTTDAEGNLIACSSNAGISVDNEADNGPTLIQKNIIRENDYGISINAEEAASVGSPVTITQNSITNNELLGINLLASDVPSSADQNSNDAFDADDGPNGFLNNPVLISSEQAGSDVVIRYALDVPVSSYPYRVEFFTNTSEGLDSSGFGEGETYVGYDDATTSAGTHVFSATLSGVSVGDAITATVTECYSMDCSERGATSEFSNSAPPGLDFGTAPGSQTLLEDNGAYHLIGQSYLGACVNGDSGDGDNTDGDGPAQTNAFIGTGPCTDDRDGVVFVNGETVLAAGTVGPTQLVTGVGPDDAEFSGEFTGTGYNAMLVAVVDTSGPADLFVYATAINGNPVFVSSPRAITAGVPQLLQDGVYITFENATGHSSDTPIWTTLLQSGYIGLRDGYAIHSGSYEPGDTLVARVDPSASGYLNVWMDTNQNGDFSDAGEFVVENQSVASGANGVTVNLPSTEGTYNLRFRYTPAQPDEPLPYGIYSGGEVEDYAVSVAIPASPTPSGGGGGGTVSGGGGGPAPGIPTTPSQPQAPGAQPSNVPTNPEMPRSPKPGEMPAVTIPEGASTDSPYMDIFKPVVTDSVSVDPRSGEPIPDAKPVQKGSRVLSAALGLVALAGLLGSFPGILLRVVNVFATPFFLRKRQRGVVYDSVTKQPLDPAYVSVIDAKTGKEVASQITDMEGRFGFVLSKGTYRLTANKTNYVFPSARLAKRQKDEVFVDLYFGDEFTVSDTRTVTAMNIPMDPVGTDWNQQEKKRMRPLKFVVESMARGKFFFKALFILGFVLSAVAVIVAPIWWNVTMLGVYVLLFVLGSLGLGPVSAGQVVKGGLPLKNAIVRAYNASLKREIAHKVTNDSGSYYILVPKAEYYLTIEQPQADGTYKNIFTSPVMKARNGVINTSIEISGTQL